MEPLLLARAKQQAAVCRLFGNSRRLLILWSLVGGELAVGEIAARVGSTIQNISQHLSVLREHDLICSRRDGQHIYYHINESPRMSLCIAMSRQPLPVTSQPEEISSANGGI